MIIFFLGIYPDAVSQENIFRHRELAASILNKMRLNEVDKTNRLIEATVCYPHELDYILIERTVALDSVEEKYRDDSDEKDSLIVKVL